MIDIHLVSWNRPDMTELVIRTLHRNTKRENFTLRVLDNGSDEPTQKMLDDFYNMDLIDDLVQIKTNIGLESARNLMLKTATESDRFVCLDNDCLAPPMVEGEDWIERMGEIMDRYEDLAALSMRTQVMIGTGNIFEEADENGDDVVWFPHPGGSFRMMDTRDVWDVGGWDRGAPGRGQEERYICGKLHEAGYRTAFATKIRCLHLFGTRGDNPTDRWGYDKNLKPEETGHSDIAHPALTNGDDKEEVSLFAGDIYANLYFKT